MKVKSLVFGRRFIPSLSDIDFKQVAKYVGLFFLTFLLFFYLTFPYDAIKKSLLTKIEEVTGLKIEIASLSSYKIMGIHLKGLKMFMSDDPTKILADLNELRVRLYPSKLLLGRMWVDFDVLGYGGGATGVAVQHKGGTELAANFKDIDLMRYNTGPLLSALGDIRLVGKMDGKATAHIGSATDKQQQRVTGSVDLDIKDLKITNSTVLNQKLPDITFQNSQIKFNLERKAFSIREFKLEGDKLSIQLSGRVNFQGSMENARINLTLKFRPDPDIESILAPYMLAFKEPDSQGYYRIIISGTPSSPKIHM